MSQPPGYSQSSQVQCPHCGQSYTVTPEQTASMAGREFPCSRCGKTFVLGAPQPSAPIDYSTGHFPQQQKSNPMAVTSLVFGVLSFCIPIIASLVAIITGIIGLNKTKDPAVGGKGLAIAGVVLGIVGIFASALPIAILLPSLNRARETANRVKCASNMRIIGQAILLYSNENRGSFPVKLEDLLLTQSIDSTVFVCPSTSDTPAPGSSPDAAAQNLSAGSHLSYVYVGQGLTNMATHDTVVLYEPMTNHDSDGMNVLYGDGHVEFQLKNEAQRIIDEIQAGHNPPRDPGAMNQFTPGDATVEQ